mmetsp:Transcript_7629/g.11758  ORF Transcript_7629/g.11758 Transcript_7629/m.11758 type:complete len:89 (-) Transcript_7629:760-1026(-)
MWCAAANDLLMDQYNHCEQHLMNTLEILENLRQNLQICMEEKLPESFTTTYCQCSAAVLVYEQVPRLEGVGPQMSSLEGNIKQYKSEL